MCISLTWEKFFGGRGLSIDYVLNENPIKGPYLEESDVFEERDNVKENAFYL